MYVWQLQWTEAVREAVIHAGSQVKGLLVLGAEIAWERGQARVREADIDYSALRAAEATIGLVVRIDAPAHALIDQQSGIQVVSGECKALIARAREEGIDVREIQLDYDCPVARLAGYAEFVRTVRSRVHEIALTITALPSWLHDRECARLARATDGFVLQVHSADRAHIASQTATLGDAAHTREWIEQAARLGVPYRVALPTYGYTAVFDTDGRLHRLEAEVHREGEEEGWTYRDISSDPVALSGLIRHLCADRPALLRGVIWFRMPTSVDRMNWNWLTLHKVMRGKEPLSRLEAVARCVDSSLVEVEVVNSGETPMVLGADVLVRWSTGELAAWDAWGQFMTSRLAPSCLTFRASPRMQTVRLYPGERWPVGWLRFRRPVRVDASMEGEGS